MSEQFILTNVQRQTLAEIFYPFALEQQRRVKTNRGRFVHYTSAQAAMSILLQREFWMRQPACMNDSMEVDHGVQCLVAAYQDGKRYFRNTLETLFEGLAAEIEQSFDDLLERTRRDLYLICVSEHNDNEDLYGRLSMWRAYGRGTGVCLVLNHEPFFSESNAFKAYSTPVAYLKPEEFLSNLNRVASNIEQSAPFLRSLNRSLIRDIVLHTFRFAVLSTKHCGFSEEKEWRIIYSPNVERSEHITPAIEVIDGVPQEIYRFPIKDIPEEGVKGLELNDLIDRIIIGPTQYPYVVSKAFVRALSDVGVQNPEARVFVSKIPLRR